MADELDDTPDGVDIDALQAGAEELADPIDTAPPSIEDFARARGWKPQEEWSGEGEWRPADKFIEFGLERGKDVSRELKEVRETTARIAETQARIIEDRVTQARLEERARWETIHARAVEEGDQDTAKQAVGQIANLAAPVPQHRDYAAEFAARNSWYSSDPEAQAFAWGVAEKNKHLPPEQQLKAAEDAVFKRFPEYAPKGNEPAKVIAVGSPAATAAVRRQGHTFSDLKPEQQHVARMLVQKGTLKSVDEYVKYAFNKEGTVE